MDTREKDRITRREFLHTSGTAAAGLGAAALAGQLAWGKTRPGDSSRPNILYIFTDEQWARALSCAGNGDLKTPAMDRLAAEGVRFTNAYCSHPLCSPSRASMFTGRMPHETGVYQNLQSGERIPERFRAQELGAVLSAAGYDCQYAGKWHLPLYDLEPGHGFAKLSSYGDSKVTKACVEYLQRGPTRPFFLVASYLNPHDICGWVNHKDAKRLSQGPIPEAKPDKWPDLPPNFGVPPYEPSYIREYQLGAQRLYPTRGFDRDTWRHYRYAYYRMTEKVDAEIGELLNTLRQQGLEDNTLIIFASDHGDGLGAHGWNQKWVPYEETVQVPFIVRFKGLIREGITDDRLVSTGLDLFPTICDYAGVETPAGLRGRSVRPIAERRTRQQWRDQVVIQTWFNNPPAPNARVLRTTRYKYTVYSTGRIREMLVDLKNDPGEMFNLVGNSGHEEVLAEHRKRLRAWCKECQDDFEVPSES